MARNEIRLRRNPIGASKSKRHKDYHALMRRHNRYLKLKRTLYILYIVVFVFLFILLFMLIRVQKTKEAGASNIKQTSPSYSLANGLIDFVETITPTQTSKPSH